MIRKLVMQPFFYSLVGLCLINNNNYFTWRTNTYREKHTDSPTHIHSYTQTQTHTHTHTHSQIDKQIRTHTHTHILILIDERRAVIEYLASWI